MIITPTALEPESLVYQRAFNEWETLHARTNELHLRDVLMDPDDTPVSGIAAALRALPPPERFPVAFGVFLRSASRWSSIEQTVFLGEFLPGPTAIERRLLEAAARSALTMPEKLPVTLEEFPSRIWKRSVASGSPARIETAAHLAVHAMMVLMDQYEDTAECEVPKIGVLEIGEEMEIHVPSGDLEPVIDLLALPPFTLPEMKIRVLDKVERDTIEEHSLFLTEQYTAFYAWALADTCEGPDRINIVVREAASMVRKQQRRRNLYRHHHTQRLGRLLFRLGHRRDSMRCAKAVGISPWAEGWQHQAVTREAHTRIRSLLLKPGRTGDAWQYEPTLACSAMSVPLWLTEAVNRVAELTELFNKAHECPWIFPRLHHVYQWHLALPGKQAALHEIEAMAPEFAVGLAFPQQTKQFP